MQLLDGELVLSPTDLTGFVACSHLTQLELAVSRGELERPRHEDPFLDVLTRRGEEAAGQGLMSLTPHRPRSVRNERARWWAGPE